MRSASSLATARVSGEAPSASRSAQTLASPTASPEEAAQASEVYRRVEEAVGKLSPEFRSVLVLRDIQDLSYEEVAATLDINLGTVKSRLARARKQVQRWLGDLV
jgi:RNA polymerase sigma-70 factor (ECF subfamily)